MTVNMNSNQQQVINPATQQYGQYQTPQPQQVEKTQLPQQAIQQEATPNPQQQLVDSNTFVSQMPNIQQAPQIQEQVEQKQPVQETVTMVQPESPTIQNGIYGPKPYAMPTINIIEGKENPITNDKTAIYTGVLATALSAVAILVAAFRR